MKKRVFNETPVPALGTTIRSDLFDVGGVAKKAAILVDYTAGAEDGMSLAIEWQDIAEANWYQMGDLTGAPAPGTNPWLPFIFTFTASATVQIPIPEHCLIPGAYRLVLGVLGAINATGTVTAYLTVGEGP